MSDILFELGCEELPPKALDNLAESLFAGVVAGLKDKHIALDEAASQWFATPRRLAFVLRDVAENQPDRTIQRRGPAVVAAFDENGKPKPAALGFARSVGKAVDELERLKTDKGEWLVATLEEKGLPTTELLPGIIQQAIKKLPIPKPMRWGSHDFSFIRPVHWVVLMADERVVPAEFFGLPAGNQSRGHRFHAPDSFTVESATRWADQLTQRHVQVNAHARRDNIRQQVESAAAERGGTARIDSDLLDEVNNIVEWPVALSGHFDEEFLAVPAEALISSMQSHQKYFPVLDENGQLLPYFIAVANIESKNPAAVIAGFERVIRPRLADARFFWEQDKKIPLQKQAEKLQAMVFEKSLGTLADKTRRVQNLAEGLADANRLDAAAATRAALLAKADLLTDMVGEFPELQGIMGGYYAREQGETEAVATAIGEQYLPAYAGDAIPGSPLGQVLSLADRVDTLAGIFAVGKKPTGNKDPFALRRAALGAIRILQEGAIEADIFSLLNAALAQLQGLAFDGDTVRAELRDFILQRLKHHSLEQGFDHDEVDAVLALAPGDLRDFQQRLQAVKAFKQQPQAPVLAAANKRIGNILRKAADTEIGTVDPAIFTQPEEKALFEAMQALTEDYQAAVDQRDYVTAFSRLAELAEPVNAFFDHVMVNADEPAVRANRLALLKQLHGLFNGIADISALAA
jgi:glycyl-tRNA synthetase beta chain